MRFNPDADLDTSRFEWLPKNGNSYSIPAQVHNPLTEGFNTMMDFFAAFFQVGSVALAIFAVMVIVAMRMDAQSAKEHRMIHRN